MPAGGTKAIVSEPSSRYAVPGVMGETLMPAPAEELLRAAGYTTAADMMKFARALDFRWR